MRADGNEDDYSMMIGYFSDVARLASKHDSDTPNPANQGNKWLHMFSIVLTDKVGTPDNVLTDKYTGQFPHRYGR